MRLPLLASSLALVALGFTVSRGVPAAPAPVPFTVLAQGSFSGFSMQPDDVVVLRKSQFERLWAQHAGTTPPAVDFAQESVIAVFMGNMPTGGFSVSVAHVETDGTQISVFVDNMSPGPKCNVIQVNTNPFVIVKVPKISLPVIFMHNPVNLAC